MSAISAARPLSPRRIDPSVPAPLATIVRKAASKEPGSRYGSAAELAADLHRFVEGERIRGRLPLSTLKLVSFAKSYRWLLAILVIVSLTALFIVTRKQLMPQDLLLADIDGNGGTVLVVANSGYDREDDSISIFRNDGTGRFESPAFVDVGDLPVALLFEDVTGDGRREIVFANTRSGTIARLVHRENGAFEPARLIELPAGDEAAYLTAGDYDSDGFTDLAACLWKRKTPRDDAFSANQVVVFWNDRKGGFAERSVLEVEGRPYSIASGDLDGDGRSDLVTSFGEKISVVMNHGGRQFHVSRAYQVGVRVSHVVIADLGGDGYPELAFALQDAPVIAVLHNLGDGSFPPNARETVIGSRVWTLTSADLDGDGDLDLAGAGGGAREYAFALYNLDGKGTFGDELSLPVGKRPAYVKAADLDGDEDLDLVIANSVSEDISVLFNEGGRSFRSERLRLRWWRFW